MTTTRLDLPELSQRLFVYIIKNRQDLISVITQFETEYNKPLQTRFWRFFYQFFRKRSPDIAKLKEEVDALLKKEEDTNEKNNKELLELIVTFYEKGNWYETSANVDFMRELINRLEDAGLSLNENELQEVNRMLRDLIATFLIVDEQNRKMRMIQPKLGGC